MTTDRQRLYAEARAAGYGRVESALRAGYSKASARISAAANERNPAVKAAIEGARNPGGARARVKYSDAEAYLAAVVAGVEVPDPARVGAARSLLPYQQARKRTTKKGLTPRELAAANDRAVEAEAAAQWDETAERIKAEMGYGEGSR